MTLQGVGNGTAAAAVVTGEGIGQHPHEFGEAELVLVAAPAVLLEEGAEGVVGGEVSPEGVERLGQGQPGQGLQGEGVPGGLRRRRQNHVGLSMSGRALLL